MSSYFINLLLSLLPLKHLTSFWYYFYFSSPRCRTFSRLLVSSSYGALRVFSCYSTSSDHSLRCHPFKSSLFQRAIAVGGRANRNLNQCFSTAGLLLRVIPPIAEAEERGEREWMRKRGKEEEGKKEGSETHITHESHLTPEITGPDGKVTAGRRHLASC